MNTPLLLEIVERLNALIDKMTDQNDRLGRIISNLEKRQDALQRAEERLNTRDESHSLLDQEG